METKNYVLLSGEDNSIIAPENEVFKCSIEEFECIWVKRELFEKQGKKTFTDYDKAEEFYDDAIFYGYSNVKPEPREREYVCVYTDDGEAIGEDPYFWDYDSYCHQWWDGSNWRHFIADYSEELELLDEKTINTGWINYGRDEYYYLFKSDDDEFVIGYQNAGYAVPISEEERFDDKQTAIKYFKNIKA